MPKKILTPEEMRAAVEAFKAKFTPGFFHGSSLPSIREFDPLKAKKDIDFVTPGVTFVTQKPEFADSFLGVKGKPDFNLQTGELRSPTQYKSGSTMYPVSVNMGKHFDPFTPEGQQTALDFAHKNYENPADKGKFLLRLTDPNSNWQTMESPKLLQHLRETGHDTFAVNEGGVKNIGVLNPANIRGKFAKYNPEDAASPDFMKAEGGSVQNFETGGLALVRHPHGQIQKVAQALEDYLKGNISQEQRIAELNKHLPIRKWSDLPPNYTDEEIRNALMANKQPKALAEVPAGMRVGNRLDIPAYTQSGVYVDTTHEPAGKAISYNRTGHLSDVEFSSKPNQAVRVGLGTKEQALTPMGAEMGSAKSPFALMKGTNLGTHDEEVRRMMQEHLNDPNWTQIGMDPRRHSQFYDKSTGMPVWSAEQKLQAGPLVMVPKQGLETTHWGDPRLELSDFPGKHYSGGGEVVKNLLEFAKRIPFTHFSHKTDLQHLDPTKYGTGMKGAEAARLASAPEIRPRSYFYHGENIQPESGVGSNRYAGVSERSYPINEDPAGLYEQARSFDPYLLEAMGIKQFSKEHTMNKLEKMIKDAGFSGYHTEAGSGLVFHPTPIQKIE